MKMQTLIRENLMRVRERTDAAARKAGRRLEEITLIGVSHIDNSFFTTH